MTTVKGQRQGLSKDEAYDQARKELYEIRHHNEIEARVAREEALSTGAYFGKTANDVGMALENKTFDQWKGWAHAQVTLMEQARNAAYTGLGTQSTAGDSSAAEEAGAESTNPLNAAVDILGSSVPKSEAQGRSTARR